MSPSRQFKFSGVAQYGTDSSVRVLHVDGVVIAALDQQSEVKSERRIGGVSDQGVASGIHTHLVHQVVFRVTISPARLDSLTSLPSRMVLTNWPINTSIVLAGSSPAQAATAFSLLT